MHKDLKRKRYLDDQERRDEFEVYLKLRTLYDMIDVVSPLGLTYTVIIYQ